MTIAIALKSIGCRTNQEEMAALAFRFIEQGHRVVERTEEADVVVVNTCSVTAATESKTSRLLHRLARQYPPVRICVTGCFAQRKARELKRRFKVDWVVGNTFKSEIPEIIQNAAVDVFWKSLAEGQTPALDAADSPVVFDTSRRTRFSIKIQEGCNFRCAYCIVPFLRGGSRSVSPDLIIRSCTRAVDAGFKEIVLTGTHIGQYGAGNAEDLPALIERLLAIPGDFRIRLSSLDPRDLSGRLADLIGSHPKLCRHLHVSVQSLSPEVLLRMNRPASAAGSLPDMLKNLRSRFPDMGIGGDFIVGFPGESDDMFEETLRQVQSIGFSYGHVFRYSKRPLTAASTLCGHIDETVKHERGERLRAALDECRRKFVEGLSGTRHRIIVEQTDPVGGLASNYLRIDVPGETGRRNQWLWVAITGAAPRGRLNAALAR